MQFAMAFKIIGVLLILFSTTMLPSLFLGLVANDGSESAFATGLCRNAAGRDHPVVTVKAYEPRPEYQGRIYGHGTLLAGAWCIRRHTALAGTRTLSHPC